MDINWILDAPGRTLTAGNENATALSIEGLESFSYAQLAHRRDQWVTALLAQNVAHGDRVGIMLLNSLDYVAVYFAIAKVGAIAVRINYRLAADELAYVVNDSGSTVLVAHTSRLPQVQKALDPSRVRVLAIRDDDAIIPDEVVAIDIAMVDAVPYTGPTPQGGDSVMLMYSSGTTGRPKGILWTHDQALWLATMQAAQWGFNTDTIALTTGPFYHAGAFEVLLLAALFVNGTAVAMSSGGVSTQAILEAIARSGATHVTLFTFTIYELLRDPSYDDSLLDNVKWLMSGGDVLADWAIRDFDQRFPRISLGQGYGLTEGGTMSTYLDHEHRLSHVGSVGRPFILTDVEIRDDAGNEVPVGEVGEIWIRSNNMSRQYWNKPEATRETFVDGWCRTGDLGRSTEDGFLILTGRSKDMIRSGGENIYPAEVEAVLLTHPAVHSIAVVAVPDRRFLEVGCAVIVCAPDAMEGGELEADLRRFTRERLAHFKCPAHFVFTTALPLNHSGKIQRNLLREQYQHLGHDGAEPPSSGSSVSAGHKEGTR